MPLLEGVSAIKPPVKSHEVECERALELRAAPQMT